ncbi:MAG: hypothetical protein EPO68_05035 [Planctomycetota bacterium]|nr:MAG: hypothetical protein EPO68_05035 [Planctomycetota bacterium]
MSDHALLHRLRFHLERALRDGQDADWNALAACLRELEPRLPTFADQPFARRLARARALLDARIAPADGAQLLRELAEATRRPSAAPPSTASAEARAAALLRGRALLLIGGDPREDARVRLCGALELAHVHWPATSEGRPVPAELEPWIARADVAAVVLLIRWIRHALNDVAALCARHDKPLARVTGGYNPSQIANALLEQCGKRLGAP